MVLVGFGVAGGDPPHRCGVLHDASHLDDEGAWPRLAGELSRLVGAAPDILLFRFGQIRLMGSQDLQGPHVDNRFSAQARVICGLTECVLLGFNASKAPYPSGVDVLQA